MYRELAETERLYNQRYEDYRSKQAEHKRLISIEKAAKPVTKVSTPVENAESTKVESAPIAAPNATVPTPSLTSNSVNGDQLPPETAQEDISSQTMLKIQLQILDHLRAIDRHKWFESSVGLG